MIITYAENDNSIEIRPSLIKKLISYILVESDKEITDSNAPKKDVKMYRKTFYEKTSCYYDSPHDWYCRRDFI